MHDIWNFTKNNKKKLNIAYRHQSVSKASTYKYLGLTLDQTLNLSDHLTKTYKKATGHLNLLRGMRPQLTVKAAITIYQSILIPLFTYCSIVTCRKSITNKHKVTLWKIVLEKSFLEINHQTNDCLQLNIL